MEIGLVDGDDQVSDARDRVELVGNGGGASGAVVGADVGAAPPHTSADVGEREREGEGREREGTVGL